MLAVGLARLPVAGDVTTPPAPAARVEPRLELAGACAGRPGLAKTRPAKAPVTLPLWTASMTLAGRARRRRHWVYSVRPHPGSILPNKAPLAKEGALATWPQSPLSPLRAKREPKAAGPGFVSPAAPYYHCRVRRACSIQGSRRRGCRVCLHRHVGTLPLEIVTACVEPADKTGIRVLEAASESAAGVFKFNMAESHLFHWQGAQPSSACDYAALAFLQATPCSVQEQGSRGRVSTTSTR
jgi:hypothetical protein